MAERLRDHGPVPPVPRVRQPPSWADGCFYPNEVARFLSFQDIDYAQLRRFYRLIRAQSGQPLPPGWSRYSFTDVACLVIAISYCGGAAALAPGRRLVLGQIEDACLALRGLGFANPLLQVRLRRIGRTLLAETDQLVQDPASGQLAIREAAQAADQYFDRTLLADPELADALEAEVKRHRVARISEG